MNIRTGALWAFCLLAPVLRADGIQHHRDSFPSKGKRIECDWYEPATPGPLPGVLLIHGADGLLFKPAYTRFATALAKAGYRVLLPHYFQATGTHVVTAETIILHSGEWTQTLREAIDHLQARASTGVVGVVGISLGASLALSTGAEDQRVRAIVECSGALPLALMPYVEKLPPVLILHGRLDPLVPVREADRLEEYLTEKNVPHERKIYRWQGHLFTGAAERDSHQQAADYLNRNLKR